MVVGYNNSLYTNQPFTDEQRKRADTDASGDTTVRDATFILKYLQGTDQTFKACEANPNPT